MDNAGVRHHRRPDEHALRLGVRLPVRGRRRAATAPTSRRWPRAYGADGVFIRSADELGPALTRGARLRPADGDPGADGERPDADARALGHQLHLPEGQLAAGGPTVASARPPHARALGADPGARRRRDDDQLPRSDGAGHRRAVPDAGSRADRGADGAGLLRVLVELRAAADSRRHLPRSLRHPRSPTSSRSSSGRSSPR